MLRSSIITQKIIKGHLFPETDTTKLNSLRSSIISKDIKPIKITETLLVDNIIAIMIKKGYLLRRINIGIIFQDFIQVLTIDKT
jgi:hypothetical protein